MLYLEYFRSWHKVSGDVRVTYPVIGHLRLISLFCLYFESTWSMTRSAIPVCVETGTSQISLKSRIDVYCIRFIFHQVSSDINYSNTTPTSKGVPTLHPYLFPSGTYQWIQITIEMSNYTPNLYRLYLFFYKVRFLLDIHSSKIFHIPWDVPSKVDFTFDELPLVLFTPPLTLSSIYLPPRPYGVFSFTPVIRYP